MSNTAAHAYNHLIGRTIGVKDPTTLRIVAATVMTPEVGQNVNLLLVQLANGDWDEVPYMDTYHASFINAAN